MSALKGLAAAAWLALLAASLLALTRRTAAYAERGYDLTADPPLARLDTRVLDVVTLGHRGLWDDIAAIWTIQLLVDKRIAGVPAEAIDKAVHTVTRHAPKIETLYMLSCFTLQYEKRRPDLCEPIILDGLKALPASWRLPLTQGWISYDKMKDPERATAYYAMAASRPESPPFVNGFLKKLMAKNDLDQGDILQTFDQLFGAGASGRMGQVLEDSLKQKSGGAP